MEESDTQEQKNSIEEQKTLSDILNMDIEAIERETALLEKRYPSEYKKGTKEAKGVIHAGDEVVYDILVKDKNNPGKEDYQRVSYATILEKLDMIDFQISIRS